LWAFGRYFLRLSEVEFWSLTFREFQALKKQWRYEQYLAFGRTGKEASAFFAAFGGKLDPNDLIPADFRF